MTTLLTNYSNLDQLIEEFRKPREEEELTFDVIMSREVNDLKIMFQYGWPYQDVMTSADGEYSGIPINLAKVVIIICEFCAKHNIDLSNALELLLDK